jgi:amidase
MQIGSGLARRMSDPFGAFCTGPQPFRAGARKGPLASMRFAAKDLIDVAGHVTGGGNPDWHATHAPATADAPVIARLCQAGATLVGKTITDELAFGLDGRNAHYGTPVNVAAPDRLPGGSSSGSAVAVASGLVDFALGTDTGGSVRVPASFCGLFGFRPSHHAVPADGVIAFAPSFDTIGWFAGDAQRLFEIGQVLLPDGPAIALPGKAMLCRDGFSIADAAVRDRVREAAQAALGACGMAATEQIELTTDAFAEWVETYRILQGAEIRDTLGSWILATVPRFGPNVAPRFASIWAIPPTEVGPAVQRRAAARARLDSILEHAIIVQPTAPFPAPPRNIDEAALGPLYPRMLALAAPASLGGLPQVTLPVTPVADGPIGLSLIGPRGSDRALLALAAAMSGSLGLAERK